MPRLVVLLIATTALFSSGCTKIYNCKGDCIHPIGVKDGSIVGQFEAENQESAVTGFHDAYVGQCPTRGSTFQNVSCTEAARLSILPEIPPLSSAD